MKQRLLVILFLLLAVQLSVTAQNRGWSEIVGKKIQTFDWNCSQTVLFPKRALQRVINRAIPSDNRGRPGTWGDRAFTMKIRSGKNAYFVPMVCGGTGNCSWRLYSLKPTTFLGEVAGQNFYTYKSSKGWPTIITYTHMSASTGILATYRFRNGSYRWIGDEYPVDYKESSGNRMPKLLEKAQVMCKTYGR